MTSLRLPLKDIFIAQPFGVNYFNFYQKMGLPYHPGVDFRARNGCKLYASNRGKVVRCGAYSDGGLGIEIQHPEGWSTFYYHLKKISVKVPISDNPVNDHAVVGAFWFKKGSYFIESAHDMINKNIRINGEFYVDECINNAVQMGLKVKVFEVNKYICWGTPNDLKVYNYWKEYFI